MIKINNINDLGNEGRAVTFGKFDGIHLGHQKLMKKIIEKEKQGLVSTVFTFDRAPGNYIFSQKESQDDEIHLDLPDKCPDNINAGKSILTSGEREDFLKEFGINTLFEYRVTKENMSVAADEFVTNTIKNILRAKYIAVGEDFRFGYKRQGDVTLLERMAESCGYVLDIIEKERMGGDAISSSRIKCELQEGNIEAVNDMLGYTYFVHGEIVKGNQLGRTWGIPTINISWPENKMFPRFGVYYSEVNIENKKYYGMTNIGIKPSIQGDYRPLSETYLYNCNENLYGKTAAVHLLHFRRREQKFDSLDSLISQLRTDIDAGKKVF